MNGPAYPLTLLYDGSCPVCCLEMNNLHARDRYGRLHFVDIAEPRFDPAPWDATLADMSAALHGVDADGITYRGVAAIRLAYAAVGLGWLWRPTGWPLLAPLFDTAYVVFARHRQPASRALAPLIERVAARRAARQLERLRACCVGRCERPSLIGKGRKS